jgi:hypothetical protein
MRRLANGVLIALTGVMLSCAASTKHRHLVSYFDRNGDGKVDLEKHKYPGGFDMDWELRDDNHDGKFEKKVLFGLVAKESQVDIPIPTQKVSKSKREIEMR